MDPIATPLCTLPNICVIGSKLRGIDAIVGHFGVNIEDGNGSSIQYIFMIFCTYIIYIKSSAIELRKTVEMAQNILHILMGLTS